MGFWWLQKGPSGRGEGLLTWFPQAQERELRENTLQSQFLAGLGGQSPFPVWGDVPEVFLTFLGLGALGDEAARCERSRDPCMVVLTLHASSFAQWAGAAPGLPRVLFAGAETEGRALAVTQGIAIFFLCQVRALKKTV